MQRYSGRDSLSRVSMYARLGILYVCTCVHCAIGNPVWVCLMRVPTGVYLRVFLLIAHFSNASKYLFDFDRTQISRISQSFGMLMY
jgi:hypothetical protein